MNEKCQRVNKGMNEKCQRVNREIIYHIGKIIRETFEREAINECMKSA